MRVELSDEARLLVDAGRCADGPSPGQRAKLDQRLAATLGVGVVSGVVATKAAAAGAGAAQTGGLLAKSTAAFAKLSMAAKLATAVVVVGGGAGLAVLASPQAPSEPARTRQPGAAEMAPAKLEPTRPQLEQAATEEEASSLKQPADATDPAAAKPLKKAPRRPLQVDDPHAPSLQQELSLLGAAQHQLRQGDPQRALAILERHEKRFPHGALRQERLAAHAMALCALDRGADGRQLLQQLERDAPKSPLATRVRAACKPAAP